MRFPLVTLIFLSLPAGCGSKDDGGGSASAPEVTSLKVSSGACNLTDETCPVSIHAEMTDDAPDSERYCLVVTIMLGATPAEECSEDSIDMDDGYYLLPGREAGSTWSFTACVYDADSKSYGKAMKKTLTVTSVL